MSHSDLLAQLASAGLCIYQVDGVWFVGLGRPCGDCGPFASADAALVSGVAWLIRLYRDARDDAELAACEARRIRDMVMPR